MVDLLSELRRAVRGLASTPFFTLSAVLILALGLGAHVALLAASQALVFRPLPFQEPDRLVSLHELDPGGGRRGVALANLLDWRAQSASFSALAAYRLRTFALASTGSPGDTAVRVVAAGMVGGDFLAAMGVSPAAGRALTEEDQTNEAAVAVITDELRRREMGEDAVALGATLLLNERPFLVVGVLPPAFEMPMGGRVPELYIPLSRHDYGGSRAVRTLGAVARLAPGTDVETAAEELRVIAGRLARDEPATSAGFSAGVESLHEHLRGVHRRPLALLTAGAVLLLIVALTNVAGLIFERQAGRAREIALQATLGAGGWRLFRQALLESLVLSTVAGFAAAGLAVLLLAGLPTLLPLLGGVELVAGSRLDDVPLTLTALAGAAGLALLTTALFALLPTWIARRVPPATLLARGAASGPARARLRGWMVAGQVALSVVLLTGAGLLGRSLQNLLDLDPGFRREQVVRFGIGIPEQRYDNDDKKARFHATLLRELESLPDVERAGVALGLPLGRAASTRFRFEGDDTPARERPRVGLNLADSGHFDVLSIPLQAGRLFEAGDDLDAPRVVLVNDAFRRRFGGGADVVGRRLEVGWHGPSNPSGTLWEVVGIIGDVRDVRLEEPPRPAIVLPMAQFPSEGAVYTLRPRGEPDSLAASLQEAVWRVDAGLERVSPGTLEQAVRRSLGDRRLGATLAAALALLATTLTAVGLYGVLAHSVLQRRRELAVRMALGAAPARLVGSVIVHMAGLCLLGLAVGVAAATIHAAVLRGQLFGVASLDPITLLLTAGLVGVVGLAAGAVPAWRAARTSPAGALRDDG